MSVSGELLVSVSFTVKFYHLHVPDMLSELLPQIGSPKFNSYFSFPVSFTYTVSLSYFLVLELCPMLQ